MLSLEFLWILALLPLPLILRLLLPSAQRLDAPLRVPSIANWRQAGEDASDIGSRNLLALLLLFVIWCLLLLAAAKPIWRGEPVSQQTTGRDLMIAVDISGSMQFRDMVFEGQAVDRLTAVKGVVGDFAGRRQGDRLGLILFGSNAYLHVPLTFDSKTLQTLLNEAQIGFAGKQTAIGDAIAMAVKQLKDQKADSRVLVLLTDGTDTGGAITPDEATKLAQQIGLKVYTIGIGAKEMIQPGIFGSRKVNPAADLNEDALAKIANATGGEYFRAADTEQLGQIYRMLDQLEPAEHEYAVFRPLISLAHWPLGVALLLSLLLALSRLLKHVRGG